MPHDDLRLEEWDPLEWSRLSPDQAVKHLLDHVLSEAGEADAWYRRNKGRRSTFSRVMRAVAIVFGAAGGLAPIVSGLHVAAITAEAAAAINQFGYLFIGLAAGILAFDRYFGVSTGWLRFVAALSSLQRTRAEFLFDWSKLHLESEAPLTREQLLPFFERARAFRLAVIDIVEKETAAWNTEFKSSYADLEKLVSTGKKTAEHDSATSHNSKSRGQNPPAKTAPQTGEKPIKL